MGLKLHGSSTWSSTTLRIRIFSCWRVHETLGKGLTPAGTFPAGGDERSGGSDVEVAFLVATGAEAEPLLRLVRSPIEEMVAGKPWWTCWFARASRPPFPLWESAPDGGAAQLQHRWPPGMRPQHHSLRTSHLRLPETFRQASSLSPTFHAPSSRRISGSSR